MTYPPNDGCADPTTGLQKLIEEALMEVDKSSVQLAIDEAVEEVNFRQKLVPHLSAIPLV